MAINDFDSRSFWVRRHVRALAIIRALHRRKVVGWQTRMNRAQGWRSFAATVLGNT
jgi:hypothetical protein